MFVLETAAMAWDPVTANTRNGRISRKFIREGELAPGVGYTSDLVKYHGGHGVFTAPRHRHNFDQIRLTLAGETDYGYEQIAGPGDATFFPAGAYYGPERFEEAEIFLLQWSPDWVTRDQSNAAYVTLSTTGEFKDGFYISTDDDGREIKKDGTNAVWEAVNGKPLVIPAPKYQQPILMRPEGFDWKPAPGGVIVKDLGHFTDEDLNIVTYRWSDDAMVQLSPERTQILWIASGAMSLDGREFGAQTILFSDLGESHELRGVQPGEATCIGLPVPGGVLRRTVDTPVEQPAHETINGGDGGRRPRRLHDLG
jgi:hypothetical protein